MSRPILEKDGWMRGVLDALTEGVLTLDSKGRILFSNPAAARMLGCSTAAELQECQDELHLTVKVSDAKGDTIPVAAWISGAKTGEQPYQVRARLMTRWLTASRQSLSDGATLCTLHDVTVHKRRTEALMRDQAHVRKVIDSLVAFVGVLTPDGILMDANRAALEIAGLSPEDVVGKPYDETYWWSYSPEVQARLRAAIVQGQRGITSRFDVRMRVQDDRFIMMDFMLAPTFDADGNVEYLIPSAIDITDRKQAENELRAREQHLQEHAALLEITPQAIIHRDREGRISYWSRGAQQMYGWTSEEAVGCLTHELLQTRFPGGGMREGMQRVLRALAKESSWHGTLVHKTKSGAEVTVDSSWKVLESGRDKILGKILEVNTDITELKQKEAQLQKEGQQLRALNRILTAHSRSDKALFYAKDERSYLREVCRIIVEECGYMMAWVGYAERDKAKSVLPVAHAGFEDDYIRTLKLTWADTDRGRGPTGTAIRTGNVYICTDMLRDPQFAPWREEALRRGYASSIALPLKDTEGTFGALMIYSREENPFSPEEVKHLTNLTDDFAYCIRVLRLRAAHAQAEKRLQQSIDELHRSHGQLGAVFEAMQDGVLVVDMQVNAVLVNEALARIMGFGSAEEMKRDIELFRAAFEPLRADGAPLPEEERPLTRALRGEEFHALELRAHRKDTGQEWVFSFSGAPILDAEGKQVLALVIARDITKRKSAERSMRQAQERLEAAQRAAHIGSWDTDIATGNLWWSPETYRMFGIPEGTPMDLDRFYDSVHPDDREMVRSRALAARQGDGTYEVEHRIVRPDGAERWVQQQAKMQFEDGKPLRLIGTAQDITERKRAEAALQQALADAQDSQRSVEVERQRWQGVVEGIADEVWVCDANGKMSLINLPDVTAMGLEEFDGKSVDEIYAEVDLLYPDGTPRPQEQAPLLRSLHGEIMRGEEIMRHRATGNTRHRQFSSAPIRDAQGHITGAVAIVRDVTDIKRTEEALRESEERFRETFEQVAVGVAHIALDGRLVRVNQKFCEIVGYSAQELRELRVEEITSPEDLPLSITNRNELLERKRKSFTTEKRYIRKDGRLVWAHVTGTLKSAPDGKQEYFITVVEDISRRKEAEEALREQEENFRTLTETVPQLVWTCTPEGACDYLSVQWEAYTGRSAQSQLGSGWLEAVHPDDREATMQTVRRAVETGAGYDIEYRIQRHDGTYRWFKVKAQPTTDGQGRIVRWVGTCTDIEEERRTMENLRFLARIQDLMGQSTEGESIVDIVRMNELADECVPFLADWCAIDLLEEDGHTLRRVAVCCVDPEAGRRSLALAKTRPAPADVLRIMEAGVPEFFPQMTESALDLFARNKKHREFIRSLHINSAAIIPLVARGKPLGIISFSVGISNRWYKPEDVAFMGEIARRLATAIDNVYLYRNAKRALGLRDDFLSIASHELKTPVTSIKAFLQALEQRMAYPESFDFKKNREYMQLSIEQVDRLTALINDLLDINRISRGTMEYHFKPLPLGPLVAEVVERMAVSFPTHRIALKLQDLSTQVNGDPLRLEQTLTNIITNAVKYSPAGSSIDITSRRSGGDMVIKITDHGIGITPEEQKRIFDPYYRTPGAITTRASGLGVGLYISMQLIKAHAGDIQVTSEAGKGSTFTITLPAREEKSGTD